LVVSMVNRLGWSEARLVAQPIGASRLLQRGPNDSGGLVIVRAIKKAHRSAERPPTGTILTVFDERHRDREPLNQWLMLQPPIWVPFAWWAILAGSIVASVVGDPGTVCTVARPCQPDSIFPMAVALVGIAAVAFWWAPAAALSAGLGYAVLSIVFDPSVPGRYAGLVVAMASVGGLAGLRALRAKQAEVADAAASVDRTPPAVTALHVGSARPRGWAAAAVPAAGVAGLLLIVGSMLGYQAQTAAEQAHVDGAERVSARVVTPADGDYEQLFELESGPRAGQRVSIEVAEELDQGSEWAVLLDPQDPTWSRLVSEPKGHTDWFGWAVLGGFVATWALLHVLARRRASRQDHAPVPHLVRVTRDGRANLTLADSARPVAWVRLGDGHTSPSGRSANAVALIRGPVADGSWVSIQTDAGSLPVVGPVRAARRWRDLDFDVDAHPRLAAVTDRTPGIGSALRQGLFVILGCFLLWFALGQVGPTWNAAHGRGVAGSFTVTSEDCGGKGPCTHYGNFRSNDGRYSFTDVELVGDSADVGRSVPALYEGQGEPPDSVFAPRWTGLAENAFYLAIALSLFLEPLGRLLEAVVLRRRPPTGRHARGCD
jgi:hypothetical protein